MKILLWLILATGLSMWRIQATYAQTTVTQPHYTAGVDALGNLSSLRIGGVEVLQKPLEFCPGVKWTLAKRDEGGGDNAQEVHYTLKSDRGEGHIDYKFEPDHLTITLTHALGNFQAWEVTASPNVLAIENLQNNTPLGAEAIQYREHGETQATPVVGMARAQRTRLYLQNGGLALFWHDGWGAPFNLDEMGAFRDYTYHRNLLENKKPMRLHFDIEKPSVSPLQPAPAFLPYGNTLANLFEGGQPVHFDLQFTPQTQERLKASSHWQARWSVRDVFDRPAGTGVILFATPTLPAKPDANKPVSVSIELPRAQIKGKGWFSVVFALSPVAKTTPAFAPSEFKTRFALVDAAPGMASNALPEHTPSDYGYAGLLGMKAIRESHAMREYFPEKGKTNWKPLDEVMDRASGEAKKYGVSWFFQANERPQWCTEADYEQIAFDMVTRCKDRCKVWEVENEPNFRYSPQDYVTKTLVPFAKGAKRADPTCTILGPGCVSVPISITFLKKIVELDALKYLDGISTHTYVGPGEPWELFGNPGYLQELHRIGGDRPLWQTEQGYNWGQVSRLEHARYVTRQYLNGFAAGIANEHHYYFYPVHNGFEPWYLVEGGFRGGNAGTLEPAAVALRVMNAQIGSRKLTAPDTSQSSIHTLRFAGKTPADGDVVALWTLDFPYDLAFEGEARRAVDFMGNPLTFKTSGRRHTLHIDGCPLYLTVAHGDSSFRLLNASWGRNYSTSRGAVASASSETKAHPAAHAIDGLWQRRDDVAGLPSRTFWQAQTVGASEQNPDWLQIDLPRPTLLDHSQLITPLPAVDGGIPRDFSLQVSDDGKQWRTIAQKRDWTGWIDVLAFAPVKTQHIRLLITRLNDGWHLDGKWMFMVGPDFTRYTDMQCRVLDWSVYGPTVQ